MSYRTEKTGVKVDELLDKIDNLDNATQAVAGLMSTTDKKKLDEEVPDRELTFEEIDELLNF